MAKLWTKPEIELLKQITERYGRSAEYNKQKIAYEFAKSYPNRTFEGIRAKMKELRQSKQFVMNMDIPAPQYNPVDVALTHPVTKTDIIRHYRDMGLRGKITLDLGE